MDPLSNVDGYLQSSEPALECYLESPIIEDGEYSTQEYPENYEYYSSSYTYAAEELEPAIEKPTKPDFTTVDGWVVESGRIALPREITVRLEKMKWNAKFQVCILNQIKLIKVWNIAILTKA